jgi:hypothetical protein
LAKNVRKSRRLGLAFPATKPALIEPLAPLAGYRIDFHVPLAEETAGSVKTPVTAGGTKRPTPILDWRFKLGAAFRIPVAMPKLNLRHEKPYSEKIIPLIGN